MNSYPSQKRPGKKGRPQYVSPRSAKEVAGPLSYLDRFPKIIKQAGVGIFLIVISNMFTHGMLNPGFWQFGEKATGNLYLMEEAKKFVYEAEVFERKIREISRQLDVEPEWLMAVIYSESKFDAAVENYAGSGAVGLIQFMPKTAENLNISTARLKAMDPVQQLEYVYQYLRNVRQEHGEFKSLTDLYIAILFTDALNQDYCFTLYSKPSKAYTQNKILDENHDGSVTVSDIDRRMQRMFPTAYWIGSEDLAAIED